MGTFLSTLYSPNYESPKKFRWDSAGNRKKWKQEKRKDENAEKKNA